MSKPDRHQPKPPELLSPWRTDARARLQKAARDFARDVVLRRLVFTEDMG